MARATALKTAERVDQLQVMILEGEPNTSCLAFARTEWGISRAPAYSAAEDSACTNPRKKKAIGVGDIGTACSEMRTVVLLNRMNLDGLEQITTDFDWFEALQEYRSAELRLCGSNV